MKNILKFLANSKKAILVIFVLLIFQAYCDLSLPSYTSDILNVGLQQGGIKDAVPDSISSESLETLKLFMTEEDENILESAFTEADADGIRTYKEDADRDVINEILLIPECAVYQMGEQVSQLEAAVKAGMMTKEQIQLSLAEKMSEMDDLTDNYLNQIAVRYVSDQYEAQGIDLSKIRNDYLLKVGFKMLVMAFFMMAAAFVIGLIASVTSAKIGRDLRSQIYQKVMSFTNAEMEHFSTASLITRSTNDIQQVQMVTVLLLRMVAYAPILAIGGVIKVIEKSSGMEWIIVLAVAILAACIAVLMTVAMPKFKQMQILIDRLNLVSREMLTGILPIRAFSRERHEEERFDKASTDLYDTQLFTNRTMTFLMPIMTFVMNGISVLIVWVGAHKIDNGMIQIGDLTAFITYSMVIVMGFLMIAMVCIMLPRAGVAADRIVEVLNMPISLTDPENPCDAELEDVKGIVEFHDVSFRYPDAEDNVIEHISFKALPGKTTAIIGSTGCGKSTVLNLIMRFFDVTEGSITLDGMDIRNITQEKLRENFGYVPQKGILFSGTIESNLKYSSDDISDETMMEAAKTAQATEFINSKTEGYHSPIAQEGSNVSGGQRQRLSIARAIARNPKVYLFDDSFSALDYRTDLALRQALETKTKDAALIIVAQRISTILHADEIIVMDEGRITGRGTHESLIRSCATYQEIARSQLSEAEIENAMKGGAI